MSMRGLFTSLTRLTGFVLIAMLHMSLDVFLSLRYGLPRTGRAHEGERGLYQLQANVLTLCTKATHS